MKKVICIIVTISMCMSLISTVYSAVDTSILRDEIQNTYKPREKAAYLIENLNFSDVPDTHWAKEAIVRLGALNIIKGYNEGNLKKYKPGSVVSNQEALAITLRVLDLEEEAQQAAQKLAADPDTPEHVIALWMKGYLTTANSLGLISNNDLTDALSLEQNTLVAGENFIRSHAVTREQVAQWLVQGIHFQRPALIEPLYTQQAIFGYEDWESISPDKIPYVESVIVNKIMVGNEKSFNPKKSVTRAEFAQTVKNADDMMYDAMNINRKNGYVAHIKDSSHTEKGQHIVKRTLLIRTQDGLVDSISYNYTTSPIETVIREDVPVYHQGTVEGLLSLNEGDTIEYLVDQETDEMFYIYNKGNTEDLTIHGVLQPITDLTKGSITIVDSENITYAFPMIKGLYNTTANTLTIDTIETAVDKLPLDKVELTVKNGIVVEIKVIGQKMIQDEMSGIVKENNPLFNYLTIITGDGKEVTKFYDDKVEVEKLNFYDDEDEIGYYDELFPDFRYDKTDSSIESIKVGDVISLKLNQNNLDYIVRISARTNHTIIYGTVKNIMSHGSQGFKMMVESNDKTTSVYDIAYATPITRDGKNVRQETLRQGDMVKLLVNQAVIEPGKISERVLSIQIDAYGNTITHIYRGQLGNINDYQRTLTLLNTYELSKLGWTDLQKARVLDISNPDIHYFKDDQPISLAYANQFLKSPEVEVYVAMEKYYDTEKAVKICFREGRDSLLNYNTITYANGWNKFKILSTPQYINMGTGTIIVKNGKLVETNTITAPDYAQVVLNGNNRAAVVQVDPEPGYDGLFIYRVRIASIDTYDKFKVQSHALLSDMNWLYSPIQKQFTLDYNTVIKDDTGTIPKSEFLDYSDLTKYNKVYTVISKGTDAINLSEQPYCKDGVQGQIYDLGNGKIKIKDVVCYDKVNSLWLTLSHSYNDAEINIKPNSIIIKNNQVIGEDELEKGDKLRIMTDEYLIQKYVQHGLREVDGYLIMVEK